MEQSYRQSHLGHDGPDALCSYKHSCNCRHWCAPPAIFCLCVPASDKLKLIQVSEAKADAYSCNGTVSKYP